MGAWIKINIENYIDVILSLNLFNDFSQQQLIQLFSLPKYKIDSYAKGQIIHLQNEVCLAMDIILDGQVSVQKIDDEGNTLKITVLSGGDVLGANLMFSNRNSYPMTIVSETKSVVLHIYKELVLELSQTNIRFMCGLMTVISDKTFVLTDKIDAISLKTIRQRINDFLKYQYHIQKSHTIKLNMSKKDLAERLGIQRTSLSRELNKMRIEGLLEYDARTIVLKNHYIIDFCS
ncbi:Crp/Fnr family transcriptional regulator [Oscillospiraceae bacterium PP1C4]